MVTKEDLRKEGDNIKSLIKERIKEDRDYKFQENSWGLADVNQHNKSITFQIYSEIKHLDNPELFIGIFDREINESGRLISLEQWTDNANGSVYKYANYKPCKVDNILLWENIKDSKRSTSQELLDVWFEEFKNLLQILIN